MASALRRVRRVLPLVAALGLLPLAGDATSDTQCCTLATSLATTLFGGGYGDEDFFAVPATPPNLMILLQNSSPMLDLATPPALPAMASWVTTSTQGRCFTDVEALSTAPDAATLPFDDGAPSSTTALTTDNPPWGMAQCASGTDGCLFRPSTPARAASYYQYFLNNMSGYAPRYGTGGLGDKTASWSTTGAKEWSLTDVCNQSFTKTYSHGGNTSTQIFTKVKSPTECNTCLSNAAAAGKAAWYAYVDQSQAGCTYSQSGNSPGTITCSASAQPVVIFSGGYLNAHPPKYIVARKIAKTLAYLDSVVSGYYDTARLGLTRLNPSKAVSTSARGGYNGNDGGQLVVPLGPDCQNPNPSKLETGSNTLQANHQAIIDAINDTGVAGTRLPYVPFYNPGVQQVTGQLAEALYYVGQYFSNYAPTKPQNSLTDTYTQLFSTWGTGAAWTDTQWIETATGLVAAPWATSTSQHSFCWPCQQSSVVLISDGYAYNDNNLPDAAVASTAPHATLTASVRKGSSTLTVGDFRYWENSVVNCATGSGASSGSDPGCGTDAANSNPNQLHKVAAFLATTDLRNDNIFQNFTTSNQNVSTYTIALGATGASKRLLEKTAILGSKSATPLALDFSSSTSLTSQLSTLTSSDSTVVGSLAKVVSDSWTPYVPNPTSFSASPAAPLQTTTTNQVLVARFRPTSAPQWEGHLYRFKLFNEFAAGCDASLPNASQPTVTCGSKTLSANLNGDTLGGNARCDGVFLLDADCDVVVENIDPGGDQAKTGFFKAQSTYVSGQPVADTGRPAVPVWDAGQVLSTSSAAGFRAASENATNKRSIYTVLANATSGKFVTSSLTEFTAANVGALKDYLGVDQAFCTNLYRRMGLYGLDGWSPDATTGLLDLTKCAKQVIHYIRGYDVLDENRDGCGTPDNTDPITCPAGQERAWKLGDIFHSTPVFVNPPATEFICDLALDPQCVSTIHSPGTLNSGASPQTTIQMYGGVDAYESYRQANASRARVALVGANDGMLHAFDAGTATTDGTGEEKWAFIPPDLLPKLKSALLNHEYFVDGNIMVRDVWVDGNSNGVKENDEFHTVAVISERSGGSEYIALDVTDPANPNPANRFRWIYPQPCDVDAAAMGESWSGFAPRPPPIGPVKIASNATRGFDERWVVMLNGGYDASLTRGRGIWMVDVWTGSLIWKFTNTELQSNVSSNGGMWPTPAAVAMLDIGSAGTSLDSDGFFDTATWGDIGGQIYLARFKEPGRIDSGTGVVTNWRGARAFEEQRQTDGSQAITNRSEFYYMTGNTLDPTTGYIHTYLGSGNRESLVSRGLVCSPDNVWGCMRGGCNTIVTTTYDFGSCQYVVRAHATQGSIKQDVSDSNSCGASVTTCGSIKVSMTAQTQCGRESEFQAFRANLECSPDASGNWSCPTAVRLRRPNSQPVRSITDPGTHNRFYGIWSYGGYRTFDETSATSVVAYDGRRFTDQDAPYGGTACTAASLGSCKVIDTTHASVSASGAVSGNSASAYDPGWVYEYGHADACSTGSGCPASDWTDEKTGSAATVNAGCVAWNSTTAPGTGSVCNPVSGLTTNYGYRADYITGVPTTACGYAGSTATAPLARAKSRTTIAAANDPAMLVTRGANGQVTYSVLQVDPGNAPSAQTVGTSDSSGQTIYWLEVPRSLHACRHTTNKTQCD